MLESDRQPVFLWLSVNDDVRSSCASRAKGGGEPCQDSLWNLTTPTKKELITSKGCPVKASI